MCPDEQLLAGLSERHVGFVSSAGKEEKYRLLHQVRLVHLIFFISVLYASVFFAIIVNPNAPLWLLGTQTVEGGRSSYFSWCRENSAHGATWKRGVL